MSLTVTSASIHLVFRATPLLATLQNYRLILRNLLWADCALVVRPLMLLAYQVVLEATALVFIWVSFCFVSRAKPLYASQPEHQLVPRPS